eukprot:3322645-Pyramimonas_sp.AAC.1
MDAGGKQNEANAASWAGGVAGRRADRRPRGRGARSGDNTNATAAGRQRGGAEDWQQRAEAARNGQGQT